MRRLKLANAAIVLLMLLSQTAVQAAKSDGADDGVRQYINRLYADRAQLFLTESSEPVDGHYRQDISGSRAAREQELRRSKYVRDWAAKRAIQLAAADSAVRIVRIRSDGETARVSLVQSLKIAYRYPDVPGTVLEFGVGTRHGLTLKKTAGEWKVFAEWYSDPLDVDPQRIAQSPPLVPRAHEEPVSGKRYDRKRAAAYADKYAGAAWGAGNNNRYNRKYRDYSYLGGDCTNYASQVLGDPEEGGGLKMTGYWRYIPNTGGSHPWVQTDRLKDFLLYSGYARLIAAGTYPEVVKQTAKHPFGAIAKLKVGDLIADEIHRGDVDHFSIVTAFDPKGYPLVNSHSADRYHVPFDLGWEDYARFLLIHIKD